MKDQEQKFESLYNCGAIARNEWLYKYNELVLAEEEYKSQQVRAIQEKASLELSWKSAKDELTLLQKDIKTQEIRVEQDNSKLKEANIKIDNLIKQRDTEILNYIVEYDKKIAELNSELTKVNKSIQLLSLVAPVDGTIHGMSTNTIGGVVTPSQLIMTIVPEGTLLIIEASLLNKDIGFVKEGQEVSLKIDTFPFQKYGTIIGKVLSISPDAFDDEKLGLIYKMRIEIQRTELMVNGKEVYLTPGMTVSAEIKTGKRRIIEFFLEPIIKYAEESLKLR